MAAHPDLQAEQAHIDRAYERVEALRAAADDLLRAALRERGSTPQSLAERDVVVRTTLHRLEQLDVGGESLCFGRIDRKDGDSFHIGRLAVSGEDQEPLVVDWRAPVAEPFYRATGVHPMGLVRRRHFATEGRRLVGIEDEVFASLGIDVGVDGGVGVDGDGNVAGDDAHGAAGTVEVAGPGALFAALDRSRSGRMRDIVATVQREQDEVIRAELSGVLVVQGGPGTGKTAVALHRAAYLLYTHRFPLERQGVLVVGPNPVFLRYIEHVLPSLGESGVALTTIEGLVGGIEVRGEDSVVAARAKGDARMARVLARAVRDRQRPLKRDLEVRFEGFVLCVPAARTAEVVAAARRRPGSHNSRRRFVEAQVARHLHARYLEAVDRRRRAGMWEHDDAAGAGAGVDGYAGGVDGDGGDAGAGGETQGPSGGLGEGEVSEEGLWRLVRRLPAVVEALERMWPLLTPEELLHDLYGARPLIRLAAGGDLSDEEQRALHRPRSASAGTIPWSSADLPLLDEARSLLGRRRRGRDERGEVRSYGHIVVDEAQDLTPMQLRMLARRSLGSMTVVGDIAQATGPRAPGGWEDVTTHLPSRGPVRVVELSVNYRTPAEIMELAGRLLAVAAPELRPPRSVRVGGAPPRFVAATPDDLGDHVAAAAVEERASAGAGTVAVIAPRSLVACVASSLEARGVEFALAARQGLDSPVTVLDVRVAKGLEFDAVVVVEPAAIVEESPQGLRALYVCLTRATKRLAVVHAAPLPPALTLPATTA